MRISLLLHCMLSFFLASQSQTFIAAGKVTDAQNGQPLRGASVFCQNTTIGTTTNADGEFQLTLSDGGYDLIVTYNGYETYSTRINKSAQNIGDMQVLLKLKDKNLAEVSIVATNEVKDGWDKYGTLFRDQFLGMTDNSGLCTIENPESLRFFYSRKRERLKVTAQEPLRINNKALGYVIRYELDSFLHEFPSGNTEYTGYALFEKMEGSDAENEQWLESREKAYYGSMLHFMRCYYDSTLGVNNYKIDRVDPKTDKSRPINNPYDSTFYGKTESGDAILFKNGKLRVAYADEKPEKKYLITKGMSDKTTIQISMLDFPEMIIIEENGYFYDQKDILALGYWSWEKLADLLPYDYDPE